MIQSNYAPNRFQAACYVIALCCVGLVLTACDALSGDHVVWSPNGQTMAILAGDGDLHLGDAGGRLSPLLASGIQKIEWLPDSQHAVIIQSENLTSWSDLEKR